MLRTTVKTTASRCKTATVLKSLSIPSRLFSNESNQFELQLRNITNDTERLLQSLKAAQGFSPYFNDIKSSFFASRPVSNEKQKTSYEYFYKEKYNLYSSQDPSSPAQEITKRVSEEWRQFSKDEKKHWAYENGYMSSPGTSTHTDSTVTSSADPQTVRKAAEALQDLSIDIDRLYRDFSNFRKEVGISGSHLIEDITRSTNVKKPASGKITLYTIFYKEHYASFKKEHPEQTPQQVTGTVSKLWGGMTKAEKIEYRSMKGLSEVDFPVK
ncbi:hypothetical protein WICPIJ_000144 [Wickerhamomyces pijperi]|uniref:HMG box domain-containing protein n=1 Tax=Wickerhamomyces pijperi TaxID=599730 RepID=A0A9P8QHL9_WICPI|nr:hypothetical protein WICPIJ_000144 [Wickerhamomyces pijperi]